MSSLKTVLFLFPLLFCGLMTVAAQNETCELSVSVYEFKADGSSEQFPVTDAKVSLKAVGSKRSLAGKNSGSDAVYTNVKPGEFELSVTKNGFKTTVERVSVDCEVSETGQIVREIVFLWPGDSKTRFEPGKSNGDSGFYTTRGDAPLNGGAVVLGRPKYPAAAKAVRASGSVEVKVTVNELGYVVAAEATSGHPLLRTAAVSAARESKFRMTMLDNVPVKVIGVIVYNFVP